MSNTTFEEIARSCSIANALIITGLSLRNPRGSVVEPPSDKGTYRSPFRQESNPSFSVFRDRADKHWCFKDHTTGESGNMINFVRIGCSLDSNGAAAKLIDKELSLNLFKHPERKSKSDSTIRLKNIKLEEFTTDHAEQIASIVGINGTEGVTRLLERDILGVGTLFRYGRNGVYSESNCFFLYDKSTNSATTRKLNGKHFGQNKSVTPNDWHKKPIGISCIHPSAIYSEDYEAVICEGEKDLIAVMHGYSHDLAIPICMPSATTATVPEHASAFHGMTCVIHAQADQPGITSALQWYEWLKPHAFSIRIKVPREAGQDWADLCSGCTAFEAEQLLASDAACNEYIDEDILNLTAEAFPIEKVDPPVPKKKGGSPRNNLNMLRTWIIWELLPEGERKAADICRALGVKTRGAPHAKVTRGLKSVADQLEQLRGGDYVEEAVKAGMAGSLVLVQRKRNSDKPSSVTTAPLACNYSEEVA